MVDERSAWRLGDAAAFERAIAKADDLLGLLAFAIASDPAEDDPLRAEALDVRRASSSLDGFDRSAVDEAYAAWAARLSELQAPS